MEEMILKGILGKIALNKESVVVKNKSIPISDIMEVKFQKGTFQENGYIAFCTGDGIGEKIHQLSDLAFNKNGLMFMMNMNDTACKMASMIMEEIGQESLSDEADIKAVNSLTKTDAKIKKLEEKKLKEEIKLVKEQRKQVENVAKCPKCGSTSLSAQKKGFGIGKAVVGASLAGPLGLMAGNVNAKKVWVTCLKCGKKFKM